MTSRLRTPYFGWTVVAVGMVCSMLSSPGQSFVLSLYVDSLIADLGISRVGLATLYGGCTLAAAACLPLVGALADRAPGRRFLAWVILLLGGAIALLASARHVATLALAFFALRLLGQGAIGLGTLTVTVRWFQRRRARALSVVGLGYAAGELIFPSLVFSLAGIAGWRGSLWLIAAAYALLFAPGIILLLRDNGSAHDPRKAAELAPAPHAADAAPPPTPHPARAFTVRHAMRTPTFWLALATVAVMPMAMTGVIFHQVAFFAASLWPAELVVTAFFAYAVAGIVASLAAGIALDRVPVRWAFVAASLAGVAALGVTRLPVPPSIGALLYGAFLGMAGGFATAGNSVVWPTYFGIASLGAIKGVVNAVRNGATAFGPPLVAALLAPGSPLTVQTALGVLFFGMLVAALLLRTPAVARLPVAASGGEPTISRRAA